jgi:hypothetical protein
LGDAFGFVCANVKAKGLDLDQLIKMSRRVSVDYVRRGFVRACEVGDERVVRALYEAYFEDDLGLVTWSYDLAFVTACREGREDVVRFLMSIESDCAD